MKWVIPTLGHQCVSRKFLCSEVLWNTCNPKTCSIIPQGFVWLQETWGLAKAVNVQIRKIGWLFSFCLVLHLESLASGPVRKCSPSARSAPMVTSWTDCGSMALVLDHAGSQGSLSLGVLVYKGLLLSQPSSLHFCQKNPIPLAWCYRPVSLWLWERGDCFHYFSPCNNKGLLFS